MIVETQGSPLDPTNLRALRSFAAAVAAVPEVAGVRSAVDALDPDALTPDALARAIASEPTATKVARMTDANAALLIADNRNAWRSPRSAALVDAIREVPHPGLVDVKVGGPTAQMVDMVRTLRDYGGLAAVLVALSNFAILLWAFRSVVVPLKAIADERVLARRELRPADLRVPGGPLREAAALRADAGRHRPHHPAGDVRGDLRSLDGLRGVPARAASRRSGSGRATTARA